MKIENDFLGIGISAKGLGIQRKKMNLIAENIANGNSVRTADGQPINRKVLNVEEKKGFINKAGSNFGNVMKLASTKSNHISTPAIQNPNNSTQATYNMNTVEDNTPGEILHIPEHPDADENGFVQMSNINTVTEMIDMISASRSYEANLTAFNSSKQMAKDSLEI